MHREPPRRWREPPPRADPGRAARRSPLSRADCLRHTGCVASSAESIGSQEVRAVRGDESRAVGALLREIAGPRGVACVSGRRSCAAHGTFWINHNPGLPRGLKPMCSSAEWLSQSRATGRPSRCTRRAISSALLIVRIRAPSPSPGRASSTRLSGAIRGCFARRERVRRVERVCWIIARHPRTLRRRRFRRSQIESSKVQPVDEVPDGLAGATPRRAGAGRRHRYRPAERPRPSPRRSHNIMRNKPVLPAFFRC